MDDVKYPKVTVRLTGTDGSAMAVIGKVRVALRKAKVPTREINEFTKEATGGNYDNVLTTAMKWVNVE
jgi:hypothetical protein